MNFIQKKLKRKLKKKINEISRIIKYKKWIL